MQIVARRHDIARPRPRPAQAPKSLALALRSRYTLSNFGHRAFATPNVLVHLSLEHDRLFTY
jgi:hypothetical protein